MSEADIKAFVDAEVEGLVTRLALPNEEPALTSADLLQVSVHFLPSKEAAGYEAGLSKLCDALTADSTSGGRTQQASNVVSIIDEAASRAQGAPISASPAEVLASYQCGQMAEAAAREFQKGAAALRKSADGTLLPDFGEQAAGLVTDALERFDETAASFKGAAPVAAARSALAEQLQRALYGPFRKQLAALQRLTLSKFRAKVSGTKPSVDIESDLKLLLKEATASFDTSAKALLPPGVHWSYKFERTLTIDAMDELAKTHVGTLQVRRLPPLLSFFASSSLPVPPPL